MKILKKVCTCCKQEKLLKEFYKNKNTDDGYVYHCKDCYKKKPVQGGKKFFKQADKKIIVQNPSLKYDNTILKYLQENGKSSINDMNLQKEVNAYISLIRLRKNKLIQYDNGQYIITESGSQLIK